MIVVLLAIDLFARLVFAVLKLGSFFCGNGPVSFRLSLHLPRLSLTSFQFGRLFFCQRAVLHALLDSLLLPVLAVIYAGVLCADTLIPSASTNIAVIRILTIRVIDPPEIEGLVGKLPDYYRASKKNGEE